MPQTPMLSPTDDQQEKLLEEALGIVKVQSFQMKCCLDKGKLMEALKHASNMLSELRTSNLSPKQYYELYMAVTDQLRHLEMYLVEESSHGRTKLSDLYELVQYAGNIIPRLYLLITVGLVYMRTIIGCRRDILKDLVEMCRGVQHPLRGLFLRNYLLQSCRDVLPDVDMEEVKGLEVDAKEEHSGTVEDSIDFVLINFAEMNKLWVRMQHQGHSSMKERRERERLELRLLVGTNLVRLSQLEKVDEVRYRDVVLPGLLEQTVSCRDGIAQEYLMECLIQVFPDEYHLKNLQPFLNSCAQLVPSVNVKNIIIALIDRLAGSKDVQLPDDLFDVFSTQISNIIKSRPEMPLEDVISMEGSLINFAIKKIDQQDKREESMNQVLGATLEVIQSKCTNQVHFRTTIGKELLKFLKIPINLTSSSPSGMAAIKMALKLSNYCQLLKEVTDIELHKQLTMILMNSSLESGVDDRLDEDLRLSLEEIETLLTIVCDPLINGPKVEEGEDNDEDFVDEQTLMSRFIHYILSPLCLAEDDLDTHYLVITTARKILAQGGPYRIRHTFPSLVMEGLKLSLKYSDLPEGSDPKWEKKVTKILQFVHQTITAIMKDSSCPGLCLRLFLDAALTTSRTRLSSRETMTYEFISQAFAIYEEDICDSRQQLSCLALIMSTVKEVAFKSDDNLSPLRTQCCLNGAKLVKKSDQVRAILSASLLFVDRTTSTVEDECLKCVKKAIKVASSVLDLEVQLYLFVEILSHLTLFVDMFESSAKSKEMVPVVRSLVERIQEQRKETQLSELIERQYLNNLTIFEGVVKDLPIISASTTNGQAKSANNHEEDDEEVFG